MLDHNMLWYKFKLAPKYISIFVKPYYVVMGVKCVRTSKIKLKYCRPLFLALLTALVTTILPLSNHFL